MTTDNSIVPVGYYSISLPPKESKSCDPVDDSDEKEKIDVDSSLARKNVSD